MRKQTAHVFNQQGVGSISLHIVAQGNIEKGERLRAQPPRKQTLVLCAVCAPSGTPDARRSGQVEAPRSRAGSALQHLSDLTSRSALPQGGRGPLTFRPESPSLGCGLRKGGQVRGSWTGWHQLTHGAGRQLAGTVGVTGGIAAPSFRTTGLCGP